jgi:hypothetical protein
MNSLAHSFPQKSSAEKGKGKEGALQNVDSCQTSFARDPSNTQALLKTFKPLQATQESSIQIPVNLPPRHDQISSFSNQIPSSQSKSQNSLHLIDPHFHSDLISMP